VLDFTPIRSSKKSRQSAVGSRQCSDTFFEKLLHSELKRFREMIWKVQGSSSEFRVRETGDASVLEDDGQTERSRGLLYLYNATRSPKPRGFLKVGSRQSPLGSRQSAVDTRQLAVGSWQLD
jgi:hypothetical protein